MNKPLVSVLMPVYNAENYIKIALDSILNQSYVDFEVLIADDKSTDNSRKIIDDYSDIRIKRFHNDINLGYLETCNNLFKFVKGDFITFQDADDFSHVKRIELLLMKFQTDTELMLCGSNFLRINQNGNKTMSKSQLPIVYDEIINGIDIRSDRFPLLGGSIMVKKDVLNSIGGYRVFFNRLGAEHVDWMMLIAEKFKVGNIPEHVYYYRYVPNSFSRLGNTENYLKYYINDLVYFFRDQRLKFGYDSLQKDDLKFDLENYKKVLEEKFKVNRQKIFFKIILNRLYNGDVISAKELYLQAKSEGLTNTNFQYKYFIQLFKLYVKKMLGK